MPVSPIFRSAVRTVSGTLEFATYPRRTSTIMSMCSMSTGHACMQARQVVQAQISSGVRTPWTKSGTVRAPVSLSSTAVPGTSTSFRSVQSSRFVLRTTSRGDSGISAAKAGHSSWQRPHLVQPSAERSCFQDRSSSAATPGFSSFSMSGTGCNAPLGREERRKMLAVPVPMWIIFENGMEARKPKAAARWTHHRILCAVRIRGSSMPP